MDSKNKITKALSELADEMNSFSDVVEELKDLKGVIQDSNEELIATFVEGTKRIIKKEDKDVSPHLKNLSQSITGGLEAVKKGVAEVERGVKSIKLPSNVDFRATGAMLKLPIKELTRSIQSFNLPKTAKDAIPVRLSDGENFYKAVDQIVQYATGGGSSYAFDTQGGSPTKAATVQVTVGGKTRDAIVVVNPDGTEIGGSSSSGGLTDAELRATPVPVSGTVTANLSATDNTVLDNIDADLTTIIGHVDGIEGLLTTMDADTGNIATSVASIDTKTPALGQALAAASVPVVLTAAQLTTLTPLSTVAVTNAGLTALNGAISGTEVQVDIQTMPGITATDLDIRDLTSNDVVTVTGGATQADDVKITLDSEVVVVNGNAETASAVPTISFPVSGTDGTNSRILKTDAGGELQVDVLTMPTTTVTATDLDIRPLVNTDVVTAELSATDNAVLDTIAAKDFATQTTLAAMNAKMVSGTDIGDVTINNASGASAVNIQDGGNTITVDGTVTANATLSAETTKVIGTVNVAASQTIAVTQATAGNLNCTEASASAIKTAVELIDNAISGSEMQVDVVAALPAGTNAIGKLAANSGVDIGDVDVTSVSGTVTTKGIPSDIDINGSNVNHADKYYTNAGAVTDGIVWSPAAGKRWHVLTLYINVSAAATVTLEDDLAGGDVARWKGELAANSGVVLTYDKEHPFCSGEDAADLIITTSAGNVYVQAVGYEI